jgi:4-amino-4-deoxy-L-arabinose transferase-like glycosyltransferase
LNWPLLTPTNSGCSGGQASTRQESFSRNVYFKIFLFALAIRWAYSIALFTSMGDQGLMQGDSYGYLSVARDFAQSIVGGSIHGWDWLSPSLNYMPLFMWALSLTVLVAGSWAPIAFALLQGIVDAGTCLLILGLARNIDQRAAVPAAIAACINPTQIILSGFVYTDTLFLFFATLSLFAATRWLRAPSWFDAIMMGAALGAAVLCRILVVPWVPIVAIFLLLTAAVRFSLRLRHAGQMAVFLVVFSTFLSPVLIRNMSVYGAWALTPQSGSHLAFWVAPLVKEARDGTPWVAGVDEMKKRLQERYPAPSSNPFEVARQQSSVARELLNDLGILAVAKAWVLGAAINLGAPAIILSPPIAQMPRTGFFGTPGDSPFAKIHNFLFRSDNAHYARALLLGLGGLAIVRILQFAGLVMLVRRGEIAGLLLLGLWLLFILGVNGPVASPKYRLPVEPPLMVLAGAGYCAFRIWRRKLFTA